MFLFRYINARKNGSAAELLRYEKKARAVISRKTYGKSALAHLAASFYGLLSSSASEEELVKIIRAHVPEKKWMNERWLTEIKRDIYYTEFFNRVNADEFFRYQFELLSAKGRHNYVGAAEIISGFKEIDDPEESKILQNKYNTYCFFQPYYKREAVLINGMEDDRLFLNFSSRHPVFFTKPLFSSGGRGVRLFELGTDGNKEALFQKVLELSPAIVEQPIQQAEEMGKFHPSSINTVRVVTLQKEGKVSIIQTSVRLGTGDSVVDNGCLSASVDTESGIITSQGRAAHEKGLYLKHPDTGEQILGSRLPAWNDLLKLVRKLASGFKKQRLVGWDMAYSTNGWVIVEANSHPGIQTLAGSGIGVRNLFEDIIS